LNFQPDGPQSKSNLHTFIVIRNTDLAGAWIDAPDYFDTVMFVA